MNEQELLQQLKDIDLSLKEVRNRVSLLKKDLDNAESDVIYYSIERDRMVESLRRLRLETVNNDITDFDLEVERFSKVLPNILKKI